ncbi:MAG: spore maturation protein [Christensenellales bacterium]|jgi:spore maturation protein B
MMGWIENIASWTVPVVIGLVVLTAIVKRTGTYNAFVEGAGDGIKTAFRIMPYIVAMMMSIAMLRASGLIDLVQDWAGPAFTAVGIPSETIPFVLLRPFSGSGAMGLISDLQATYGVDSLAARTAAVMMGSSETLFYVLALYFGSVHIKRTRHAMPAAMLSLIAGYLTSAWICRLWFG